MCQSVNAGGGTLQQRDPATLCGAISSPFMFCLLLQTVEGHIVPLTLLMEYICDYVFEICDSVMILEVMVLMITLYFSVVLCWMVLQCLFISDIRIPSAIVLYTTWVCSPGGKSCLICYEKVSEYISHYTRIYYSAFLLLL